MKILVALTYYRPHVSGLTVYVQRLSEALVQLGHSVTVLTSQYERSLPREEEIRGVRIQRVPVLFRISKAVVMPTIGFEATAQVLKHDVLSLHLPQLDAAGIALRGRLLNKPTVLTYHCDLRLPAGLVNRIGDIVVPIANRIAVAVSDRVVAYTEDYAKHSPLLAGKMHKVSVILPPVEVAERDEGRLQAFRARHLPDGSPVIGMASRLATEKGVEILLRALPRILERHPNTHVLFAGQHEDVLGEADYARRLAPMLQQYADHWSFLGVLAPREMVSFYNMCDVTVLPSLNSTESFGLVQIESMICGTPVVASELPGVRQPVAMTGMGRNARIGDPYDLAAAILQVIENPEDFSGNSAEIERKFSPQETAHAYLRLFEELRAL